MDADAIGGSDAAAKQPSKRILGGAAASVAIGAAVGARPRHCPYCAVGDPRSWGRSETGARRFRCGGCRWTFSAATGTIAHRLRRRGAFGAAVADMLAAPQPGSCRGLAARLGVGRTTIWRWRMRVLARLATVGAPRLAGRVEAAQFSLRESRKASREWVRHLRDPGRYPAPDRPRWHDRPGPAEPWRWRVAVLATADPEGRCRLDRLPGLAVDGMRHLTGTLGRQLAADSVAYMHRPGDPGETQTLRKGVAAFLRRFRGPASRYVQRYLDWHLARLAAERRRRMPILRSAAG